MTDNNKEITNNDLDMIQKPIFDSNAPSRSKRYSDEFRQEIVNLYNQGRTQASLEREYGVTAATIGYWIKNSKEVVIDDNQTVSLKEYKALQKKLAEKEAEVEILKLAAEIGRAHV
jgi:transposase